MKQSIVSLAAIAFGLAAAKCLPPVAHEGTPIGKEVQNDNITLYVTGKKSSTAVLYLTDVYGIQLLQNKLLADSFGHAGYLTIAPDMFNGTPAPGDIDGSSPDFNVTEFLEAHGPEITDPIIASAIKYIRNIPGVKKIAATGYCFGGRYAFRFLSEDGGVDAGFAAHPSLLEDAEIDAITRPVSVATAETDSMMSPERRSQIEKLLQEGDQAYSLALYGGTSHGFGVRANISDPQQKYGKEQAFYQAVSWFDAWA